MNAPTLTFTCRWTARSPECVEVSGSSLRAEFTLAEVMILLGTRTVVDLYDRRRATVELDRPLAWPLKYRRPSVRTLQVTEPTRHDA